MLALAGKPTFELIDLILYKGGILKFHHAFIYDLDFPRFLNLFAMPAHNPTAVYRRLLDIGVGLEMGAAGV